MSMLGQEEVAVGSEVAALRRAGYGSSGVRPRDWRRRTLEELDDSGTDRLRWVRRSAEIAATIDEGDLAQALVRSVELMGEADSMSSIERKLYVLMHSLLVAHVEGDGVEARRWFDASRGGLTQKHDVLTAEAAVQHAEGATEQARKTLVKARAAWDDALYPVTEYHRELAATVESKW